MNSKNIQHFKSQEALRSWFMKNHNKVAELWIGFYKKASNKVGASYSEALDEALCFGWIDGIKKSVDELSFAIRFTPRRSKSVWSKVNVKNVERLTKENLMQPSGLKEVESAKKDGRFKKAYDSQSSLVIPKDFLKELAKNKKAKLFYASLNKTNLFAINYRLQTSKKPETRERWIRRIIEILAKGEKFHL